MRLQEEMMIYALTLIAVAIAAWYYFRRVPTTVTRNGSTTLSQWFVRRRPNVGWSHDIVAVDGDPYLERWIVWLGFGTLRLHRFWTGDDDDPHDHPFWFWTIPLRTYREKTLIGWRSGNLFVHIVNKPYLVGKFDAQIVETEVRAFRTHFRPAHYAHVVLNSEKPFFTLVITGRRIRKWGFWVDDATRWVPYEQHGVKYDNKERVV